MIDGRALMIEAAFENDVAVIGVYALSAWLTNPDIRTVQHGIAQLVQPGKGGVFDDGL